MSRPLTAGSVFHCFCSSVYVLHVPQGQHLKTARVFQTGVSLASHCASGTTFIGWWHEKQSGVSITYCSLIVRPVSLIHFIANEASLAAGNDSGGGAGRQVPVQRRAVQAGLGSYLPNGGTGRPQQGSVFELVRIDHGRPARTPAVGRGYRPRMRCSFSRVGEFHLPKQGQHKEGQLGHGPVRFGGVDCEGIS
jgi:hypothetical protein